MTILIISSPYPLIVSSEIEQWKKNHVNYDVVTDFESIPNNDDNLFSDPVSTLVLIEEASAKEVRSLLDYQQDILIVCNKKPKANFKKDGIQVIDKTKITKSDFIKIAEGKNVGKSIASTIYSSVESLPSAISMVEQLSLIDSMKNYRKGDLYDLFPGENPPWDITNSIVDGNTREAIISVQTHLSKYKKKSDAISLIFQLSGYFKKVAAAVHDTGNISSHFFKKQSNKIKDVDGLINDISYYPSQAIQSSQPDVIITAMVSSLSSRFK